VAREAVRVGGLLAGGADTCVWTRRVFPSIRGTKDGLRVVKMDGAHNTMNNDILRRLFADLATAYDGAGARTTAADAPVDDRSLLQFYTEQCPGSQRMANEVNRRLTVMGVPEG
jgi:hypothetical protein